MKVSPAFLLVLAFGLAVLIARQSIVQQSGS